MSYQIPDHEMRVKVRHLSVSGVIQLVKRSSDIQSLYNAV